MKEDGPHGTGGAQDGDEFSASPPRSSARGEISACTVSSFLAKIEHEKEAETDSGNKSDFLFRGQNSDAPLLPRIARLKPKGKFADVELLMRDEFERLCQPFTEFEPKNEWDLLALAQHHGLPTRLLDWCYNALAALWFSVKSPPKIGKSSGHLEDGVVWLLKTSTSDFIKFPTVETPYSQVKTGIFRPRSVSRRIPAQTGVFTCHNLTTEGVFSPLESNPLFGNRLVRIAIPASSFGELRKQLFASGVTNFSLFPDLDGLAGHLQFRYFHDAEPEPQQCHPAEFGA